MTDAARRSESQRLLGIASKLLESRDLTGAKDFATSAQDSDPLLDGSDQILAISDVLLAADKKVNGKVNWYAILQLNSRCNDLALLKKQYRKLAILLHPDKNKYSYCGEAFKLVSDAWDVVSDSSKKAVFDKEVFGEIAVKMNNNKRKIREGNVELKRSDVSFWTACPYCYNLHQYPRVYVECVLKCNTCGKVIHAVEVPSLPLVVKGKDGFDCVWGCFPMGYAGEDGSGRGFGKEFPNWMPPFFANVGNGNGNVGGGEGGGFGNLNVPEAGKGRKAKVSAVNGSAKADFRNMNVEQDENVTRAPVYDVTLVQKPGTRKRGRPRKDEYVNGSAEADFRKLNVEQEEYVTRAPVYDVTSVQKPGIRKRGRPRKDEYVNATGKADFRKLNVEEDEYVTRAPVYDVTSVQKPGTGKRGRPRKNPIK